MSDMSVRNSIALEWTVSPDGVKRIWFDKSDPAVRRMLANKTCAELDDENRDLVNASCTKGNFIPWVRLNAGDCVRT